MLAISDYANGSAMREGLTATVLTATELVVSCQLTNADSC